MKIFKMISGILLVFIFILEFEISKHFHDFIFVKILLLLLTIGLYYFHKYVFLLWLRRNKNKIDYYLCGKPSFIIKKIYIYFIAFIIFIFLFSIGIFVLPHNIDIYEKYKYVNLILALLIIIYNSIIIDVYLRIFIQEMKIEK